MQVHCVGLGDCSGFACSGVVVCKTMELKNSEQSLLHILAAQGVSEEDGALWSRVCAENTVSLCAYLGVVFKEHPELVSAATKDLRLKMQQGAEHEPSSEVVVHERYVLEQILEETQS